MEEVKSILSRNYTSEYILYKLEELKSLFSRRLGININDMYNTNSAISHMIKLIMNKPVFDLEQIKLDILNNKALEDIAIYYKEPIIVIEEIKDNITKPNYNIVSSKVYLTKELKKIFVIKNMSCTSKYKILKKINLEKQIMSRSRTSYWLGKDILDVYDNLVKSSLKQDTEMYGKEKLITLQDASRLLGFKSNTVIQRLLKKDKIMGIELSYEKAGANVYFLKYNEIMAVKDNIKKYIEVKKITALNKDRTRTQLHIAKTIYKCITNKVLCLSNMYIKKTNAIIFTDILNLFTLDIVEYTKKVKQIIQDSEIKTFKLSDIKYIIYRSPKYHQCDKDGIILTKKEALLMFDEKINKRQK